MATARTGRAPRFVYLCDGQRGQPGGRYGWRLVAANHRPLGRGRAAHDTLDACRADAARVCGALERLQATVITQDGMWYWQAYLRGELAAMCVHSYLRRIECARALTQFLAAARETEPAEGVVRHFGARSLRGYQIAP